MGEVGVGDDRGVRVDVAELAVGRFGDAGDDLLALADRLAHLHPLLAVVDLHIEDSSRLGGDDVAGVGREDDGGIVHLVDVHLHPGAYLVDRADGDAGDLLPDASGHLPGVQRWEEPADREARFRRHRFYQLGGEGFQAGHLDLPGETLGKEEHPDGENRPDNQPRPLPVAAEEGGRPVPLYRGEDGAFPAGGLFGGGEAAYRDVAEPPAVSSGHPLDRDVQPGAGV